MDVSAPRMCPPRLVVVCSWTSAIIGCRDREALAVFPGLTYGVALYPLVTSRQAPSIIFRTWVRRCLPVSVIVAK
jgi:hypothetical protein